MWRARRKARSNPMSFDAMHSKAPLFISRLGARLPLVVLAICLVLFSALGNPAQAAAAAASRPQSTPQSTVRDFYRWYLGALAQHRVPLEDDRTKMRSFVVS